MDKHRSVWTAQRIRPVNPNTLPLSGPPEDNPIAQLLSGHWQSSGKSNLTMALTKYIENFNVRNVEVAGM